MICIVTTGVRSETGCGPTREAVEVTTDADTREPEILVRGEIAGAAVADQHAARTDPRLQLLGGIGLLGHSMQARVQQRREGEE